MKPDLDSKEEIAHFLQKFYGKLLKDPVLAPIFLEVAGIDIGVHLEHIQNYWEKLLLGEDNYQRHTMNIHRALHGKHTLTEAEFDRWLNFYVQTIDESFYGLQAEKAKRIASHISENMKTRIVRNSFDTDCKH